MGREVKATLISRSEAVTFRKKSMIGLSIPLVGQKRESHIKRRLQDGQTCRFKQMTRRSKIGVAPVILLKLRKRRTY